MPKGQAVSRNADRNPNLGGDMEGKQGYKMPKQKPMTYSKGDSMSNSIRAANVKRMGKKHNPGY